MTALIPGSGEWLRLMTASKVAAVLGVSPWESQRSIWHKMRGEIKSETSAAKERGHYLEPAILAWFFDQHPELVRAEAETFIHPVNTRFAATPDAVASGRPVEAKSDAGDGEWWGAAGTDEIPLYYAAQCVWTCHVMGADRCYVPMITSRLEFREYVVPANPELAAQIESLVVPFLVSLAGDVPPAVDGHVETYASLRRLNPLLEKGEAVDLTDEHARLFTTAYLACKAADERLLFAKSTLAEVMGTAQFAYWNTQLVARRQNTSGATPAIYAAKPLPTIPEESAAA